jgi:tetratricopeptide (TPR) repeat protein
MTLDGPTRPLRLAQEILRRLGRESANGGPADAVLRLGTITGQAHLLAGQAGNWNGALEKAREHLNAAYSAFAASGDSDGIRLALTEFHESQRRSFAGRPGEGLALARRSRSTFDELGLEDYAVRARIAEGIALSLLDRDEEALSCFRGALPVFEREGLWTNYVSALNSLGASLARLGRLDEARREYSRALRKLSRDRHASILAFIRHGLAIVLVSAGRHRDAASSFLQAARLFESLGLIGDSLTASLWEIESWARSGDQARALHRLEIFRSSIDRPEAREALDPFIVEQLEEALSGRDVNFERLGQLRRRAQEGLREKLQAS